MGGWVDGGVIDGGRGKKERKRSEGGSDVFY